MAALAAGAALFGLSPAALAGVPASARPAHEHARPIDLPHTPAAVTPLHNIGLRKDELLTSVVPGPTGDREAITTNLGPTGTPTAVTVEQRLHITGTGDYAVRERGPALNAVAQGDTVPPVLELGTVIWEGFSPGHRRLAARLRLDPVFEAARLPMTVGLAFQPNSGRATTLGPTLRAPADGTLTVTLTDATAADQTVPLGAGSAPAVAHALEQLEDAARKHQDVAPPAAGRGLPRSVGGQRTALVRTSLTAALRIAGSFTVTGPAAAGISLTGSGTSPGPDGATQITGTLDSASVSFQAQLHRGDAIRLDLDAQPCVDPRQLMPPQGNATWAQWARSHPSPAAVSSATRTLVTQAGAAARADEYIPYLEANLPGVADTTFAFQTKPLKPLPLPKLHLSMARPGAIVAMLIAVAAITVTGVALRRQL